MMSELTRFLEEAQRLAGTYAEHSTCEDTYLRRKVHVDLDRFLMENRETIILLTIKGIESTMQEMLEERRAARKPWYKRA